MRYLWKLNKWVLGALLALLLPIQAFAAACASNAAGDWNTAGSWTSCSGGVPGIGDTASITHAITLAGTATFGTSGASGTNVLTISGGGSLTISGTMNIRGGFTLNNAPLTLSAGSTFTFDASAAAAGSKYVGLIGTAHNQTGAKVVCNGTSGSHVTIQSNTAGSHGWFDENGVLQGGKFDCDYADFIRIGDSTNPAIQWSPSGDAYVELNHCTFDANSGRIYENFLIGNDATFILTNNSFRQTAPSAEVVKIESYGAKTSGTRTVSGNWFEKQVLMYPAVSFDISENVFNGGLGVTCSAATKWTSFTNNFSFVTGNDFSPCGDIDKMYIVATGTDNPHYVVPTSSNNTAMTFDEVIMECPGCTNPTDHGDGILMPDVSSVTTYTVTKSIMLPSDTGQTSGANFSMQGNANTRVIANHNTQYITANDALVLLPQLGTVGETWNTAAGQITSFKSNLMAASAPRNAYLYDNINGSPNADTVAGADANYNNSYNISAGSAGKGYDAPFSVSPGANDLAVDPQFVDPTRDIKSWSTSLGGAGTLADIRDKFRAQTAGYTVSDLITWVQHGFKVMNASLNNAGHDGVTIGAMDYVTPTPTATPTNTPTPTTPPSKPGIMLLGAGK